MTKPDAQPVLLVVNPRSGRGQAARAAEACARSLDRQGLPTDVIDLTTLNGRVARGDFDRARALVVFGGDGTVHSASALATQARAPIYQVPFGTENLFARAFGMNRSFTRLRDALRSGRTTTVDSATCAGRPFLLMCSVGPDASIVHRVAAKRNGTVSHLSYAAPILREALAPALPPLTVTVDGRSLASAEPGFVFVANFHEYAMGLDPARHADPTDGVLDAVFLPTRSTLGTLAWSARLAIGMANNGSSRRLRGRSIEIVSDGRPAPVQLDGEAPPADPRADMGSTGSPRLTTPVRVEVRPASLRVLLPRAG